MRGNHYAFKLAGYGVMLISLFFLSISIYIGYNSIKLCIVGKKTVGIVTGYTIDYNSGSTSDTMYSPNIRYRADEKIDSFNSQMSSNWKRYSVNQKVPVIYNGSKVNIYNFSEYWFPFFVTFIASLLSFALGLLSIKVSHFAKRVNSSFVKTTIYDTETGQTRKSYRNPSWFD